MVAHHVMNVRGITEDYFDGRTPREERTSVRKQDKVMFTRQSILDFLELRKGTGATIRDVINATGFDRHTISNHLAYLVTSRQVYVTLGSVYHKNGRILHHKNIQNRAFNRRLYTFYHLQQNFDDDYVYIQEKEVGKLKTVTVKGGIMVSKGDFKNFICELSNFSMEMEKIDSEI